MAQRQSEGAGRVGATFLTQALRLQVRKVSRSILRAQFPPGRPSRPVEGVEQHTPRIIRPPVTLRITHQCDLKRIDRPSSQAVYAGDATHYVIVALTTSSRPSRSGTEASKPSSRFAFSLLPTRLVIGTCTSVR